ncbi:hypothetical protein [Flagellimonas meridianipacifica]|uniref:hypothetical protein n=1 Tax=Flagellimonas meridianipacifica TaxID=1080225 RepID=UPI0011B29EA7|nr:hypothetical protein [Allomuricauda pacifica]
MDSVKLLLFDLRDRPLGWSSIIEIPELTKDVLQENTILFYLETEDTCLKLPVNNETLGYTANVFKNIGKVYLTFKCIKDGVSNYTAPMCHLKSLKMLIIKPESFYPERSSVYGRKKKYSIHNFLKANGVNIHDYEETLGCLSNFCKIDFSGYHKNRVSMSLKNQFVSDASKRKPKYSALMI